MLGQRRCPALLYHVAVWHHFSFDGVLLATVKRGGSVEAFFVWEEHFRVGSLFLDGSCMEEVDLDAW